jgi:hypothetical protein
VGEGSINKLFLTCGRGFDNLTNFNYGLKPSENLNLLRVDFINSNLKIFSFSPWLFRIPILKIIRSHSLTSHYYLGIATGRAVKGAGPAQRAKTYKGA